MGRRELDYYPTPPDAVLALGRWIDGHMTIRDRRARWIDPAAGEGVIIEGLRYEHAVTGPWHAIDVDGRHQESLEQLEQVRVQIADAIDSVWPWPRAHVCANPPYGSALEAFVSRIDEHTRVRRVWGFVLTSLQWLDDGQERHSRFRPLFILRMPWRNRFTLRSPRWTHCWLVYGPNGTRDWMATESYWLERPALGADHPLVVRHREMIWRDDEAA